MGSGYSQISVDDGYVVSGEGSHLLFGGRCSHSPTNLT